MLRVENSIRIPIAWKFPDWLGILYTLGNNHSREAISRAYLLEVNPRLDNLKVFNFESPGMRPLVSPGGF